MNLTPGAQLGPYEIIGALGAGGMGEVYRARDTRLGREVAIKILPAVFASDPDRLARFTREAHTLAQLNHPHIAHIYGFEDSGGVTALVMELVDGPTLADMLATRAIPLNDALDITRQIAEALEAAHEQGIVHRDLKPANVKVRTDGAVKVLDFGLAKAIASDPVAQANAAIENSPTFTQAQGYGGYAMTQVGVILGTTAYMAPEQARGKIVDRRADIWAFGCLLYEMLAGQRPFTGETVTDVLSAIVSREPDWTALPGDVPVSVTRLVRRCLHKDPRRRLRDIGEARLILEAPGGAATAETPQPKSAVRRGGVVPALAAVVIMLALTTAWLLVSRARPAPDSPDVVTRFDVEPPDPGAALNLTFRPAVALSADGRTLAFVATTAGIDRVYLRTRDDVAARPVPGSEGGTNPALSPDGRWIAFFADGKVRKATIGGEATTIGTARDVRGLTWTDDGMLVMTDNSAGAVTRMSSDGQQPRPLTQLAAGERTHRWLDALPGGRSVLFTVGMIASPDSYDTSNVEAVNVATGERRVVLQGAAMARYCGDGRLLYSKGPAVFSVRFDPDRLTTSGAPVQVLPAVARDATTGAAHFACARDGTLAFVPASTSAELRHLVWYDEKGQQQPTNLPPGPHQEVRISPDGKRAALLGGTAGSGDVWIYEFASGTFNRLTFTATNAAPIWSADGRTVYFTSFDRNGAQSTLFKKPADGSREAAALGRLPNRAYFSWVDPQEQAAILEAVESGSDRGNIVRFHFPGGSTEIVANAANDYSASVSPGGRWLAYSSDETGRNEVFVQDLTGSGARWQVTSTGGLEPHWSSDGRQLFYRSINRLMAAPIEPGTTFRAGKARPLFDGIYNSGLESGRSYHVDPVTGRFLLVRPAETGPPARAIRVVLNWPHDVVTR